MMSNIKKLKKLSEKPWFYPMALFLIALVTYGYTLSSLGYYWSDWEVVMYTKLSPAFQFGFYAEDRPFPWTYDLIYFLVGSHPIGWQSATLLIRWAGTLFFVYAMIQFWPDYKKHFFWLGALLLVYPGFVQQTQSAAFSRHIASLLLFSLSLYLMVIAIKRPKLAPLFFPLSWVATFMHLFTIEYFSGFEFIRPVLVWVLVANGYKINLQVLRRILIVSLPYLLVTAFFFWVRFVYFPQAFQTLARFDNISSTMSGFKESFVGTLLNFFNTVVLDLLHSTVQVWINSIVGLDGFTFQQRIAWFAFGLGALFAVVFSFLYNTSNEEDIPNRPSPASIIFNGLILFVASAIPVWAIGKEISTGGWNERFTLAPMFGASLMVVGLVLLFVRPAGQKWIYGFLLIFSVATQVWIVNAYRRDWTTQSDYYWQLFWRAPG
ncbi:MAG TPA: hypothetical protein DCX53_00290, partial [Anaerolineae bacterium]|nr:hypothetical protein [Anaerolineae bacterium]